MHRKFFIALALVVVLSFSCQQELDIEPLLSRTPIILNVEPNPAKPGDVITITGRNFAAYHLDNYLWIGNQRFDADSGSATRLFARIPWGANSGTLSLKVATDSVSGPTIAVTQPCNLPSGSSVCLNLVPGTTITDSSSWVVGSTGIINKWSASISSDTITLTQFYTYGDDSGIRRTLRFRHLGNNILPFYVGGTWTYVEIQNNRTESLQGYIAIEHWNIPGVLSGRVSTYNFYRREWKDFNFYYEMK